MTNSEAIDKIEKFYKSDYQTLIHSILEGERLISECPQICLNCGTIREGKTSTKSGMCINCEKENVWSLSELTIPLRYNY